MIISVERMTEVTLQSVLKIKYLHKKNTWMKLE